MLAQAKFKIFEIIMKQRGFTLIELIVAMVIIGILMTVATVNYEKVRAKSRDLKRKTDMSSIAIALDSYYANEKKFPGERKKSYHVDNTTHRWQTTISDLLLPYLDPMPVETGPNIGDSYIGDNPCLDNSARYKRNYNYFTEQCSEVGVTNCPTEPVVGYILIARLELYDDPDLTSTVTSGCGSVPIEFGKQSRLTLTGHPLFTLSK